MIARLIHISIFLLCIACENAAAQVCPKDSNFYSITYNGYNNNVVTDGLCLQSNEVVTISQYSVKASYITKFTGDGSVIWSNDYTPNFPFINSQSFPWYNQTEFRGIIPGDSSTFYAYGSAFEHGRSVNNVEYPAGHYVGLLMHIDRSGNVLSTTYLGNWGLDYTINSITRLANGYIVVYLRSPVEPYIDKIVCIDKNSDILWGQTLQSVPDYQGKPLYLELQDRDPVMRQMTNGSVMVAREMIRNLDDTLVYPFLIVILPAPLVYFDLLQFNSQTGALEWENNYQCPMITGTNVPAGYKPTIKSITELPNGNASLMADIYMPDDDLVPFWNHQRLARRAVNFFINSDGYFTHLISYAPPNPADPMHPIPVSLEYSRQTAVSGEQIFLMKSTVDNSYILSKLNSDGDIIFRRAFKSYIPNSQGVAVERVGGKGYFLFEGEPFTVNMHLSITNVLGNDSCAQLPVTLEKQDLPWPWPSNKFHTQFPPFFIDIRHSPNFPMAKKVHPLGETIDCQYEQTCCKDVIDSVNQHNIDICEGETYTLPGNVVVKDSGQYYVTDQTTRGCDSIVYYNVRVMKSPSHMFASRDTCLNDAATIQLSATPGYDTYWWDEVATPNNTYSVSAVGAYQVRVQNICGSKTDTVQVFDQCNFPIYFPSGFTPNNDGKNDVLRVPPQNRNLLKRLAIFNRWGQIIFQTTQQGSGWDGTWDGVPQPTGVYVYFLEMKGLSGDPISQKGTVTLIR